MEPVVESVERESARDREPAQAGRVLYEPQPEVEDTPLEEEGYGYGV